MAPLGKESPPFEVASVGREGRKAGLQVKGWLYFQGSRGP